MQGGCETRRSRATGWDGPKACPLVLDQALGEHRAPAQLGEGSGDPFSLAESCGAQKEAKCAGEQDSPSPRPAGQAQGASPQADNHSGQAAGAACSPAGQGPATPKRVGHDPH
eukprot:4629170-Amphidinium_carterae.1